MVTPKGAFASRCVLVTGAGRGLGKATALAFAREGASVAVVSRTSGELEAVAAEIRSGGSQAIPIRADVRDTGAVRNAMDACCRELGTPDVVVNCAGIFRMGPSETFDLDDFRTIFETNVLGTFAMCQAAAAVMLPAGRGKIINFASLLSFTAFPQRAAYAASKGAVLQLTRTLGVEWASRGICVNAVAPGMIQIDTPHPAIESNALRREQIDRRVPLGRSGLPDDVVGTTLFLASPAADYICGQTIVVDGGWLSYGYL